MRGPDQFLFSFVDSFSFLDRLYQTLCLDEPVAPLLCYGPLKGLSQVFVFQLRVRTLPLTGKKVHKRVDLSEWTSVETVKTIDLVVGDYFS